MNLLLTLIYCLVIIISKKLSCSDKNNNFNINYKVKTIINTLLGYWTPVQKLYFQTRFIIMIFFPSIHDIIRKHKALFLFFYLSFIIIYTKKKA